jgi:hypothetical protein
MSNLNQIYKLHQQVMTDMFAAFMQAAEIDAHYLILEKIEDFQVIFCGNRGVRFEFTLRVLPKMALQPDTLEDIFRRIVAESNMTVARMVVDRNEGLLNPKFNITLLGTRPEIEEEEETSEQLA